MNEQTERRAIAFIRTIANRCASCLRRSPDNCRGCVSQWANDIMRDYENDTNFNRPVNYSFAARCMRIVTALNAAPHPLLAVEIPVGNCTSQLKHFTLNRLVEMGRIKTSRDGNKHKLYFTNQTGKDTHNEDNRA